MAREPKNLDKLFSTLPKMAKAPQNQALKAAFEKHRRKGRVVRLEQVFAIIDAVNQEAEAA
jgi:ferritin-like metal-binding protein YciE